MTERQQELLDAIKAFSREHGYPPTIRELSGLLGNSSTNATADAMRRLRQLGHLVWEDGKPRTLRVVKP